MTLQNRHRGKLFCIVILLIALSLACARSGSEAGTTEIAPVASSESVASPVESIPSATVLPQPTPTPQPLPPALVEVDPPLGADFPLQGPLTLYFNQAMDQLSVEAALSGQPGLSGRFTWGDDHTVTFEPDSPFLPDTDLTIEVATSALAANGQFLVEPIRLTYKTASPLKALQVLPEPDVVDADPTSALVVTFNQPVVPLGADPASMPAAFSIEPAASGSGEWVNTSTYIFYPDPPLTGGQTYTVKLSPGLKSTSGGSFLGIETSTGFDFKWSFRTAPPRLMSFYPGKGASAVRLDSAFKLEFSQPMNAASVEENFTLYDALSQPVAGEFGWSDDFTTLVYTPTERLSRGAPYNLILLGLAKTSGDTALGVDYVANVRTVPELGVTATEPLDGGSRRPNSSILIRFNGPVGTDNPLEYISFSPEVKNLGHWWDDSSRALSISGDFEPISAYTVTVSADLPDPWDGTLGEPYTFHFTTTPLDPNLFIAHGESTLFLTPEETTITAQASNLDNVSIRFGSVPFDDLVTILSPGGYSFFENYKPADQQNWTYNLGLPGDRSYITQIPITPSEEATLAPGIYHLSFLAPQLTYQLPPYIVICSNVQMSFKLSPTSAFVWAVDLRTNRPVPNATVTVYDTNGTQLAGGQTDKDGVFQAPIPTQADLYSIYYAVLGEPGDELFSLAQSNWSQGIEGYEFGYTTDFQGPDLTAYIYTDRPIYRPGQTVNLRAVVRYEQNGRYTLPDVEMIPVTIFDGNYIPALQVDLPLSEFGTAHESYTLPENAQPGNYQISTPWGSISFQVAEYRKPEINLQVDSADAVTAGDSVTAQVSARYFFDAPAGNTHLTWNVYKYPTSFYLPAYQVGVDDFRWMGPNIPNYASIFGEFVSSGEADTSSEGLLTIEFATSPEDESPYRYTLEVTLSDESGFPVSARSDLLVHPSDFYAGIRPDTWVGQAGTEIGFEVLAVGWDKKTAGVQEMKARFQKITWVREDSPDPFTFPTYTTKYTPVSSASFRTAPNGIARLAFTPPEAGTYVLDVSGGGAHSQALVWVGGTGQAIWPNLPNQQLRLTTDKDEYTPGDTAEIFIPNPFDGGAQALITIERDEVLRHEVFTIKGAGHTYTLSLTDEDAPNVYVSVTLIGKNENGDHDFRQGYLNLPVKPVAQTLEVTLTAQPEKAGPRDEVTFKVRVTDADGNPVQGEFSLAVVDLAALALADPNSVDILPAFYAIQPLGVRNGMSLVVYAQRRANVAGGLGGGGGEEENFIIREDFPDTAYWNAEIVTDANGEAEVTLTLPDSLTTWEVDLRGLTADTLVGQAREQVVATKDLLVRPVTPRFAVVSDHLQLAAVAHNNTGSDLQVNVGLQATGFILDDPTALTQEVSIPAGGRVRVEWWGTVEDVEALDVVFSASAGGLQDASRPTLGDIPVLRFLAPQTFGTAGVLDLEGERLEIVSLPLSFDPSGGTLQVELAPSLAAAMTSAFDVLEYYPYECTEQTLSRFLPNLMTYRAIQELGLDSPDLEARLDRTLDEGIRELTSRQNEDGGWGWWPSLTPNLSLIGSGVTSDDYITAYVVFGLSQARAAGVFVDDTVIQNGVNFLLAARPSLEMLSSTWQLDRLAFHYYAVAQTGSGSAVPSRSLYEIRNNLNPYAKAFLALTLAAYDPADERIDTLLSDLSSSAVRSATGIHWEGSDYKVNLETPAFNTAVVIYALAQEDPASFILPEAVRYLMSARRVDGSWGSTYETAWSLLALTEVMKGTGELASDFGFSASLNGSPLLNGQAASGAQLTPVEATVPVSELYLDDPNALSLQRTGGPGRLYYAAHLSLLRPAEDVTPLNRGIGVERFYEAEDSTQLLTTSDLTTVRIALTLESDAYYLVVEDHIPAGAEILDINLKTSQQGAESVDVRTPFAGGWGWWYFADPQIYDDHIAWAADYIPAGTYELTYTLVLTHPGEYQVLPARAWEFYFPEVQGNSAGDLFVIEE